ncbi:mucin-5AC-like [Xenopus laevis]|uniref:Mucin-5AC-like n=1 Tax=Xenopus laevis TaxID=8355 RepID=A0A8J1KKJ6_XENLA|nr:mucin-5AC-like [Xenopus laevis]
MECVPSCCYDSRGRNYLFHQLMPSEPKDAKCTVCMCTRQGRQCFPDQSKGCCEYDKTMFTTAQPIYSTPDRLGGCNYARCENGTIVRYSTDTPCTHTTTIPVTTSITTTSTSTSTPECHYCKSTEWIDVNSPEHDITGDIESFENIRNHSIPICESPMTIRTVNCRAKDSSSSSEESQQSQKCNMKKKQQQAIQPL